MKLILIAPMSLCLLSGCVRTTHSAYDSGGEKTQAFERQVRFDVRDRFYRDPPRCTTVLSVQGAGPAGFKEQVARAAARHFSGKVERVIGPFGRQRLTRRLAFNLSHPGDRRHYASRMRCGHFVGPTVDPVEESFALIWAGPNIGLSLTLTGVEREDILWRGSHQTTRGDGGLPISPLALGGAMIRAARARGDTDQVPSMIDDVLRRMLKTVPDVRGL
jgi:hypothetical protein